MVKRKMRIICSPTLAIGTLIAMFSILGFYLFTMVYEPCRIALIEKFVPIFVMWTIITAITIFGTIFAYARKIYSIITIDETGISRSFLGVFCKLHMSWDNIAEICYFTALAEFLVFSKNKKVSTMTYNKMRMEKDAIEMTISRRRYRVIKQYLQQPIVGMPEKVKERLEREK